MIDDQLAHNFHIPVMGIGFTIDTPVRVAQFGISSVISLVDDKLMEKMRKLYCQKMDFPYDEITETTIDYRADRITAYLNMVNKIVKIKFNELKKSISAKSADFRKYVEMLPSKSRHDIFNQLQNNQDFENIQNWLDNHMHPGSIDVNIMTKVNKENYHHNEKLPVEYNDAFAALRGFANSDLESSVVFSAGINPGLYGYIENFKDFFPDENGKLKKKITLKVSDFRSALIQSKFLAKRGLWVSEFRIESGLNCGGHAFATNGYLMGPILDVFKNEREELVESLHTVYISSLKEKNMYYPEIPLPIKVTAQGGVGTAEEHKFLLNHYKLDSVGWGTPFLLVPEVTNVDPYTRKLLSDANEDKLYLSNISPLGIPFNSLRGNTKDLEKEERIFSGNPGSPCRKKFLVNNTEFSTRAICTASNQYQGLKLKEIAKTVPINGNFETITDKSCICVGLGTSALLVNNLETNNEGKGVSVCPGPNMAYFSGTLTLKEMVDHIYGRINIIKRKDRPHMFISEIKMYIEYWKQKINESSKPISEKQVETLSSFQQNLNDGIEYYKELFTNMKLKAEDFKSNILNELDRLLLELNRQSLVPVLVEHTKRKLVLK